MKLVKSGSRSRFMTSMRIHACNSVSFHIAAEDEACEVRFKKPIHDLNENTCLQFCQFPHSYRKAKKLRIMKNDQQQISQEVHQVVTEQCR
jgi:hypothetical protein